MKHSDINYQELTLIKNKRTNKMEKDLLIHAMINPFDLNYILAFHSY